VIEASGFDSRARRLEFDFYCGNYGDAQAQEKSWSYGLKFTKLCNFAEAVSRGARTTTSSFFFRQPVRNRKAQFRTFPALVVMQKADAFSAGLLPIAGGR
jgi:hypothetical protein